MTSPLLPDRSRMLLAALALSSACGLFARADCTLTNTGQVPLPELGLNFYSGYPGGLYPNAANNRPPSHLAAGLQIATNSIQPRDATGAVNTSTGKIVLLSSGMSNTTQEWASKGTGNFRALANADNSRNPKVVVVDGAIGGQDAKTWTNINSANWQTVITQRLANAGVTTNQVQALWIKQAIAGETGPLPVHAGQLEIYLEQIVRNAKTLFPNLQLIYLSSRTRAYVYGSGLNPEPYAFETAFAVKWLVEKQISGVPELNYDPALGAVRAPYLSWGPYLWSDGLTARSDGFTWLCSDLETDFTHPSAAGGVPKVGAQLLAFFKTDPTATSWFLKPVAPGIISCTVTASVASGSAPLTVTLGANAVSTSAPIRQYAWTFDDGEYAFGSAAAKVFRAPGTYQVRVTATDTNGNTATASASISVSSTFTAWQQARFSASQLTNSLVAGPAADPDADGLPNRLEYALGTLPLTADAQLPTIGAGSGFITVEFPHYKPAADVALTLETSTNLVHWSEVSVQPAADHGILEQLQARVPVSAQDGGFFRLRAEPVP